MKHIFKLALIALIMIIQPTSAKSIPPKPAPDFLVQEKLHLSDLKGKVVFIDFWASWCGPCRKSFPWLNKINKQYPSEDFMVVSINLDAERHLAEKFLKQFPAEFSITYDPMGDLAREYEVRGMPSSYIIDHQGNIAVIHMGFRQNKIADYEKEIERLVKQKQAAKK
jgi:thiol-disulfide isomerase/thioredoxin